MGLQQAAPLKVAIVGTGLAGLSAAHVLDREATVKGIDVELHLFERVSSRLPPFPSMSTPPAAESTPSYMLKSFSCRLLCVSAPTLGFHASSFTVANESGSADEPDRTDPSDDDDGILAHKHDSKPVKPWIVDVPMRSFQGGYYPHLLALYKSLFIPIQPKQFTYSFAHLDLSTSAKSTHFLYSGNNGAAIPALPSLASRWTSLGQLITYAVCYAYLLLLALSHHLVGWPGGTVTQWTTNVGRRVWGARVGRMWEQFVTELLVVLFGAVATCSDQTAGDLDVGLLLDYIYLTLFTSHYTAPSSSSSISRALAACVPASRTHLGATISVLSRDLTTSTTSITYHTDDPSSPMTLHGFHEVILATQANQAKRLLDSLMESLDQTSQLAAELNVVSQALDKFRYVKTIVVNHTSASVLPTPASDVREINLLRCPNPLPQSSLSPASSSPVSSVRLDYFPPTHGSTYTQSTHILYPPPSHAKTHGPVYQTTNPIMPIPKETVLAVAHLERALPTAGSTALLPRLHPSQPSSLQGVQGIWLVGAYAWEGIPLLEGCVRSSEEVVTATGGILDRWISKR